MTNPAFDKSSDGNRFWKSPAITRLSLRDCTSITPDKGTPDPPSRSFDLDEEAASGAVVRVVGDRVRVRLGTPKTPYWSPADGSYAKPKIFLDVATSKGDSKKSRIELGATELTLDLLLPKVGTFSALTSDERTLDVSRWSSQVGEPMKFTLRAKLSDAPRTYGVKIEVETFVRDVIDAASAVEPRP